MPPEKYRNTDEALMAALALPDAHSLMLTVPPAVLSKHPQLQNPSFLGRGGMGTVYRAFDTALERDVAIKLVRPGRVGDEFVRRLQREASALRALKHPGIVELLRIEEHEGQLLMIMAFVDGMPLRRHLRTQKDVAQSLGLMLAVGEALCAAHASGFFHRDVKPDNILVRRDGTPCLLDFGLARAVSPGGAFATLTSPGQVLGTPYYMAPEQARGERGDARSDQYAWAVTSYEACTGRHPRIGGTETAPMRPSAVFRSLPPRVEAVFERAMSETPAARFASMDEAVTALRTALSPTAPGLR